MKHRRTIYHVNDSPKLQAAKRSVDLQLDGVTDLPPEALSRDFNVSVDLIERFAAGFRAEDDLLCRLRMTGWFQCVVKIDQTPYLQDTDIQPPDLLVIAPEIRPDWFPRVSLIEVKCTDSSKKKMTARDLERRIAFADACGMPLFFALRVMGRSTGYWMLKPSWELKTKHAVPASEVLTSWWDEFFGDFSILLPGGVVIEETWDPKGGGRGFLCRNAELGGLKSFVVRRGRQGLELSGKLGSSAPMHAIFSYFPPEKEERVERGGEVIVSRHLAPKTLAKFSDILLNLNLHVGKGFSSSSRLLRGIATGSKLPFPWHLLTAFIIQAEEQGFLFAFHNRRGTGDLYGMTRSTWAALVSGD